MFQDESGLVILSFINSHSAQNIPLGTTPHAVALLFTGVPQAGANVNTQPKRQEDCNLPLSGFRDTMVAVY